MTTELATVTETPQPAALNLFSASSPQAVVTQATACAKALAGVIKDRNLYRVIGKKAHVYVEAWTLLGSMLGVFPVLEETEQVEINGVSGWKATVAAKTRAGETVGRATALCLRNEAHWKTADEYAVCSMAQTRAVSKALRQPLGFVVTLAGYSATPAEEIPAPDPRPPVAAAKATKTKADPKFKAPEGAEAPPF
jgi:hypothetical protein